MDAYQKILVPIYAGQFGNSMKKSPFARVQKTAEHPSDFYTTPRSLVWVAKPILQTEFDPLLCTLDPCSGDGAISDELKKLGHKVSTNDLYRGGVDYLKNTFVETQVIMNPPFSLWDEFIGHAKTHARKILSIGRLNCFGAYKRHRQGLWNHLKAVYCFNRCIDYRTPPRLDGKFYHSGFTTGWFLWDIQYTGKPILEILDVQPYCTLGKFSNTERLELEDA
jgi:hypothetical protein